MIERIYVHNYRCFENFTLDLKGKPSALVIGRNGSGKSTLRHALRIIQLACRWQTIEPMFSRKEFGRHEPGLPMRIEVGVTLGKRHYEYSIAFEWPEDQRISSVTHEKLTIDDVTAFARDRESITLLDGGSFKMELPGPFVRMIGGDRTSVAVEEFRTYFSSALLLSPVGGGMSGHAEGEQDYLHPHAGNFGGWLNRLLTRYPARYSALMKYLQAVMPDLAGFEFVPVGEKAKQLRVQFERPSSANGGALTLDFGQLSDGEKCFFLSGAITEFHRKDNPLFSFWDEPDNHLAMPEVSHFVTHLRRMTNHGGQFLATSHHPETIRRFSDENTFVLTRNSHLEPTVVRPLSDLKYTGDVVDAILRGEVI